MAQVHRFSDAAAYARERPVSLAVEPLNRFETDLINTVDWGLWFAEDTDADNVGLLLDTVHTNIDLGFLRWG
jgi:D-psicose/D-tagatose/L-ribulose 3-epimerase